MIDAIERLADRILGHMGIVGIMDDQERGVILVYTTESVNDVRRYLGDSYEGFPIEVRASAGIIAY